MAKRRFGITEDKIARFVREGRGLGSGKDYLPWLTVHDLSSLGRTARMLGRCNRRIHHLFSDVERGAFLEYDWRDDVVDIREQFPLDRGLTRVIAADMGIRHPRDPQSGVDVVMTTDLLIDFADGSGRAVACKRSGDLAKRRTAEKLEIERRYWERLGRPWMVWTELSTSKVRVQNLGFLHEFIHADEVRWHVDGYWLRRATLFIRSLESCDPETPFSVFAEEFERIGGFQPGDAISTMRYLACRRMVSFDLDVRFDPSKPLGRSLRPVSTAKLAEAA